MVNKKSSSRNIKYIFAIRKKATLSKETFFLNIFKTFKNYKNIISEIKSKRNRPFLGRQNYFYLFLRNKLLKFEMLRKDSGVNVSFRY